MPVGALEQQRKNQGMSDCCPASNGPTVQKKRHRCPVNGMKYKEVKSKTIIHHLNEPWAWVEKQQAYYFCGDPECDVVYFGQDNSVINKNALRTAVGVKQNPNSGLVCYCFGVSFDAALKSPAIKQFVTEKTKIGICACGVRNPSGKCCLKDFPRQ